MSIPTPKVEVGFDLTDSPIAPFFRLNNSIQGRLDNPEFRLGGKLFVDVTDRVRSVNINRGRPNILSNFPAGEVSVDFNNHDRAFDPLYPDSPFVGNIVPRREIRVSSNDQFIFTGWIEDWNLDYTPNGDSTVTAVGYDAFYILAGQALQAFTPSVQKAHQRIDSILDRPGVNWASQLRNLEPSTQTMGAYPIADETNALQYIQRVAESEPGNVFIDKIGRVAFTNRVPAPSEVNFVTFGVGNVPFDNLRVVFGAENLFNEIVVTRQDGGTAIASDTASQSQFGVRNLEVSDLLVETDAQIVDIAVSYAVRFSQPEYRFESLEVDLHKLSGEKLTNILNLELGSVSQVNFLPNGIEPAIQRFVQVINITHTIEADTHYVQFGFKEVLFLPLVLDDTVFGKLDEARLAEGNITRILTMVLDDAKFGKIGIGTLG